MAEEESEPVVTVKKVKKVKEAFQEPSPESHEDSENSEDDEEDNEGDEDFEFDMEDMNLGAILQNFLVNEDGVNVADIFSGVKKSLDTQNKILMKIVGLLETKGVKKP